MKKICPPNTLKTFPIALAVLTQIGIWLTPAAHAQMPNPPGQVTTGEAPKNEAYLFAHMMDGDYGGFITASAGTMQ